MYVVKSETGETNVCAIKWDVCDFLALNKLSISNFFLKSSVVTCYFIATKYLRFRPAFLILGNLRQNWRIADVSKCKKEMK